MFQSSVCSYPKRGHYGDNRYRGNCSGLIVKDFFESFMTRPDGLVADPSVGGGTSGDVAKEMGIRFVGTDLHQGFNLLRDDLGTFLNEEAHLVWWHPPYWSMIEYSGNQWGTAPNKWDMSRMDLQDFVEALEVAVMNIHDAVEPGGHYGILMGNMRRKGEYYNLSSLVERIAPGKLVDELIKTQHNCVSDSRQYRGRVIRIAHEKLLVFRRNKATALAFLLTVQKRAQAMVSVTWKAAVRRALQGKTLPLAEIYQAMAPFAATRGNQHWQAKVRQCLQDERYFERVETGVYALAS